jgi:two-component system phosphate regulon response regulator PhoB
MIMKNLRPAADASNRLRASAGSGSSPQEQSVAQFTGGRPILIADDEIDALRMVATHLTGAGFKVIQSQDGADALAKAQTHLPALVVLDIMMPEMTGLEVCRALKASERTAGIGVIMLTARNTEVDRVLSFELGADDYLAKPFSPRELVLRITSILRRHMVEPQQLQHLKVGEIAIDKDRHYVTARGREVTLTAIEFRLLVALIEQQGRVLSRDALLNMVWGYGRAIEARTVDTHLRRLREKLGVSGRQIQTVRGFGYRLDEI